MDYDEGIKNNYHFFRRIEMEKTNSVPNRLLILGNGFDLCLDRDTRYSDFVNSSFWPKNLESELYMYLERKANLQRWFDLESELARYIEKVKKESSAYVTTRPNRARKDEADFKVIVKKLIAYLKNVEQEDVKKDSIAAKVFSLACRDSAFSKIYSFNYTDLFILSKKLELLSIPDVEYVHGCLADDSAILGINDTEDTLGGLYDFMRKSFNPHYSSHPVSYDLKTADEVVFFGHSLGDNDYHYFQSFFRHQCEENLAPEEKRAITIFTKDENGRMNIMRTLHKMNDGKTSLLFQNNILNIFCTDDSESQAFREWYHARMVEADRLRTREFFDFAKNM